VEFDLMYGEGISAEGDVLDLAATAEFIEKSGAWYSYKGERMGQGREGAKLFLKEHPELISEISQLIMSTVGAAPAAGIKPAAALGGMNTEADIDDSEEPAEETKQPFTKGAKGQKRKSDVSLNGAEIIV